MHGICGFPVVYARILRNVEKRSMRTFPLAIGLKIHKETETFHCAFNPSVAMFCRLVVIPLVIVPFEFFETQVM